MSKFKRVEVGLWKHSKMKRHWYALHKALWLWLSRNPGKTKHQWPGWYWNGGAIRQVEHNCFACYMSVSCSDCKLAWETGHCSSHGFKLWEALTDVCISCLDSTDTLAINTMPRVSELALKIMNTPLKENNHA